MSHENRDGEAIVAAEQVLADGDLHLVHPLLSGKAADVALAREVLSLLVDLDADRFVDLLVVTLGELEVAHVGR